MHTPYFRAGAGSVIYRADGKVLIFKRTGEDIWQFQQGGLDAGETPKQALWRELEEETALSRQDFMEQHPYPTWTLYAYPDGFVHPHDVRALCLGQTHKWWFLKLAPETAINLEQAPDKEFEEYTWLTFDDFMSKSTHSFKQSVYAALYEYFNTHIKPDALT